MYIIFIPVSQETLGRVSQRYYLVGKILYWRCYYKEAYTKKDNLTKQKQAYFVFSVISLADLLCKTVILTEDKNTWNNLLVYFKWELKFCIWTPVKGRWTVYKKTRYNMYKSTRKEVCSGSMLNTEESILIQNYCCYQ